MVANNRKSLAQNFLTKSHLAASLLDESSICSEDIVYEIGPGAGKITKELQKRTKKVIAIEKDRNLYVALTKKFALHNNVILHNTDFLEFKVTESKYKVFANIPFNITSAIMRKLLYGKTVIMLNMKAALITFQSRNSLVILVAFAIFFIAQNAIEE